MSFLLAKIKNLASHYPPARQALETRREEGQSKVAAGALDIPAVMDLISLNHTLGQKDRNFAVFDRLPSGHQARDRILSMLADQFLEAKRYADLLDGTDGKPAFQKAVDRYNRTLVSMGESNPMKSQMELNLRHFTVNCGSQQFEALAGLKRNQDAKELAGQILKFDSSEATRLMLAEAAQRAGNDALAQAAKQ